jgi:hypothetical protein
MVLAVPAVSSADTFGVGNGHRGPLDLSACTGNAYVNEYTTLTSIAGGGLVLNVGNPALFVAGDLVMVWQPAAMSAATVPSQNQNEFVLTGTTGAYELARVTSKTATSLTLAAPLSNLSYTHAQVVLVPEFSGVNIGAACTLAPGSKSANTPQPWDGSTGGIVAFFSDDSLGGAITNVITGAVSADGAGFEGIASQLNNSSTGAVCANDNLSVSAGGSLRGEGVTSVNFPSDVTSGFGNIANAGGGGNCQQSAGGGGSNGGRGGNGGVGPPVSAKGFGGAPVAWRNLNQTTDALYPTQAAVVNGSLVTRLTFGGGGGHGQTQQSQGSPGGRGGGVVFIRANRLTGPGGISANGAAAGPVPGAGVDGQAGGGGGGTVVVRLEGALGVPCGNVQARGGNGANGGSATVGGGGGGGGGRVLIQSTTACAAPILTGGAGGTAGGSASGSAGATGTREVIPNNGVFCADGSASSDALCAGINPALPHCNAAFNNCAECATDTQCTNPLKPRCDIYGGVCTCATAGGCPASAPVCNTSTRTCGTGCSAAGGSAFCAGQYGSNPGNPRFCETAGALNGQCVPCTGTNNSQCPNTAPVCAADSCNPCTAATLTACSVDHAPLVCDTTSGACVQCTSAQNCSAPNGCVNNICGPCNGIPSCSGSTSGPFCAASGACVQCLDASQCSPGQGCVSGSCGGCTTEASCAGSPVGPHCAAGSCVACRDASDCTGGQGCVNHQCAQCSGDPSCAGSATGLFCVTGSCSQCRTGADCSAGQGCVANVCGACSGDMSCQGNSAGAHCTAGACVQCTTAADCAAGLGCVSGVCGACSGDASCMGSGSGSHCASGTCSTCASNADCVDPTKPQCAAGLCVPCTGNGGCTGHAQASCELSNATNPALVGTCVECTSSPECMSSSTPRCDSATDTCVAALDAGTVDAGSQDAGAPDAGGVDAGETLDAGPLADAGEGTDGGENMDAGQNLDAGQSTDAGPGMDAGNMLPDAGLMADGGPDMMQTQGCGCGSAEGLFSLLALALLGRRRRK